ncbi:sigma-70 family RNA polymerase sigma factor [Gemmata sp. JC717]|uniref:RNA polymerase sigma factor n=1 Tax=Gemmata algarum TaxID=2975278 RepID=UPI0021BA4307|nr:sigma-70 family RNA polymerase sigma factor [Gemmata algarum]MDY3555458.1 sigma-70 family RNA polymerase sigma factor [Gemmata algarum]
MSEPNEQVTGLRLDQISTHVATLGDAEKFFVRYGRAVGGYLRAILQDPGATDEVMQELVLALLRRGGVAKWPGKGRFRDYLKAAARNAAITHLRRTGRQPAAADLGEVADPHSAGSAADRALLSEWQRCLLDRVWRSLEAHERRTPGNICYTALKVFTEFPHEPSPRQAAIATQRTGHTVGAEAFRKQVSRARCLMAELILTETARGVIPPTADGVEAELHELGLWPYVEDHLPDDWRARFFSA